MWSGLTYGPILYDEVVAQRFTPSNDMQQVVDQLSLTSTGKRILYASQPQLQDKADFNTSCNSRERTAAILGCYYMRRIYVYNVDNAELVGAMPVTTAHEMLHAAYDRLSSTERAQVDGMIERQYEKIKDTPVIHSMITYYEQAEPGERLNELHSIIGTQIEEVDSDLEEYYSKYFTNRRAIVKMSDSYQAVFDKVNEEATKLSAEIKQEETDLQSDLAQYKIDMAALNADIQQFNQQVQSGAFSSAGSFGATRSQLLTRQEVLEETRVALNQRVQAYNDKVAELNSLAVRAQELNKSINGIEQSEGKL